MLRMRRAALAVLLTSAALASPAAQPQTAPPTFRTGANYVRVDVYPTRNGMPVDDLRRDDFELLDDKVPQTIDEFEHVVVRGGGAQDARREPNTVAESRQAALEPRARVLVLFLDVNHVELAASRRIRTPLVEALDRLIGPDDLIAVMTPEMSARDVTFARRTTAIEGFLTRYWWGERDRLNFKDPVEDLYARCYPGIPRPGEATAPDQGIAQEMILRHREKQTLDALEDLVRFLGGVREERKAVIAITDGWRLYERNNALARPIDGQVPTGPIVGINPATGTLGTRPPDSTGRTANGDCERDRFALSQLDDATQFRFMLDEANRANASFYPIDPRGLAVFDEDIVPAAGVGAGINANPTVPPAEDRARLFARNTSLRTLAEATDGLAVVNTNDLSRGLRRIADDLSSYYLLGYYSTGKLDGRFHALTVRVRRPGVQVRARRGYLATTEADAAACDRGMDPGERRDRVGGRGGRTRGAGGLGRRRTGRCDARRRVRQDGRDRPRADRAGRDDRPHRADVEHARRRRVPAADPDERCSRRRSRQRRAAHQRTGGAAGGERALLPARARDGQPRHADRGPALPAQRAPARRRAHAGGGRRHRARPRSKRQPAGDSRHRRGARRSRWVALAVGGGLAGAAGARRLPRGTDNRRRPDAARVPRHPVTAFALFRTS